MTSRYKHVSDFLKNKRRPHTAAEYLESAANLFLHNVFCAKLTMIGWCRAMTELRHGVIHCLIDFIVSSVQEGIHGLSP